MRKILLNFNRMLVLFISLMSISVFANEVAPSGNGANSLYARMGGTPVMTKMIDEFVDVIAKDARTMRSFDGIKLKTLKESIVLHICHITGGGCVYEGETMANSHRDANITEAEFDAFVSIFRQTIDKYLPTAEKNALLKILAPMKRDIVMPVGGHPANPNALPAVPVN